MAEGRNIGDTTTLADASIVRNRAKIAASISNAQAFLAVQTEFGSFSDYIWAFTFVLSATYFTVSARPIPAGMLLALCTGCRFEYAAITGPILMLTFIVADKGFRARILACVKFAVSAAAIALLVFEG